VEARATVTIDLSVEAALPLLEGYSKIGLATTVQHVQMLNQAREILVNAGKTVIIGEAGHVPYAGQVIGCDYSNVKSIADEVDAFLFLGGGIFHALGIALSTSKPTIVADPYDNRAFSMDAQVQKILKQRWACIQESQNAKTFGVIVGLKPGQKHFESAIKIKHIIEKKGKTAYLFTVRELTPEIILEFPGIDAYVNTACPRISLESFAKFSKPVLTENEFMVVIGEFTWESMLKKGLFEK
jgi:2-(3-amino-3-carboxypropyl)histidine synthase